jgi:hypothetical protein
MKHNDYDLDEVIRKTDLANIFHVYTLPDVPNRLIYNISRTFNFEGLENISTDAFYEYRIQGVESWPTLAYKIYTDTRLWWILCKLNGVIDPTQPIETGSIVKILKEEIIFNILDNIERG